MKAFRSDDMYFMLIDYFREPKYPIGTLIEHKKLGIFRVVKAKKNIYYFRTIVWYNEDTRKNRNIPYKCEFREIENLRTFEKYSGGLKKLQELIHNNAIKEIELDKNDPE